MNIAIIFVGVLDDRGFNQCALDGAEQMRATDGATVEIVSGVSYEAAAMTKALQDAAARSDGVVFYRRVHQPTSTSGATKQFSGKGIAVDPATADRPLRGDAHGVSNPCTIPQKRWVLRRPYPPPSGNLSPV